MFHRLRLLSTCAALLVGAVAGWVVPASATFHLMQIEQVIGGVDGSTSTQAIQLRMRASGQNLVASSRLIAWDAAGANPVLLIDFASNVASGASGARVLVATADFSTKTNPPLTPDFVLASPIPASYLAAGSLTFEDDVGTVYWRLSWGGLGYSGSGLGHTTNDLDGNFSPPFGEALPSGSGRALRILLSSGGLSTNNLANYALTDDAATFTKNSGASGTVQSLVAVDEGPGAGLLSLGTPFPNPARVGMQFGITLPREMHARVAVHDAAGRDVALLANRTFAAGRHDLGWDGRLDGGMRAPSGVYFLELQADRERRVRRFVLLR